MKLTLTCDLSAVSVPVVLVPVNAGTSRSPPAALSAGVLTSDYLPLTAVPVVRDQQQQDLSNLLFRLVKYPNSKKKVKKFYKTRKHEKDEMIALMMA